MTFHKNLYKNKIEVMMWYGYLKYTFVFWWTD